MTRSRNWTLGGSAGQLAARTWEGDGDPRYVALLSHGYGEHTGRYGHVADALVANGAVLYAVDHAGHGRSEGERVEFTDVEAVVDDLHAVDERARQEHPGLPVVLIGHSMGGLIAARYAQRYGDTLAALVLSGPVVGEFATVEALLALPEIPDVPLDSTTLSRDPAVGEAYEADPLVWHGPFKRPMLEAWQRALAAIASGPGLGALPLLWVHGADDRLVPVEGSRSGIAHLGGGRHEERIYHGAQHEVFNETNAHEVLADVTGFLDRALAGRDRSA